MCKRAGASFADYFVKDKGSHSGASDAHVSQLRQEISHLNSKYYRLNAEYASLYAAHMALQVKYDQKSKAKKSKKKSTTTKDPVAELEALKRKYRELKKDYEELEEEQEENFERNEIIDCILEGTEEDKENALIELVKQFIDKKRISVSNSNWTSSTALYNSFIDNCHDIQVMSNKKFSQIFSSVLNIKPIKGGKLKNLMGFSVYCYCLI
jgi:hypothetical protein